ncbi:MAG TPA: hypothetical protein VGQ81_10720 [Acidobacteriota bacterium]|jgi:hypothetical protein|nr:hypothetical protein [Acidobacteriota bacterium]
MRIISVASPCNGSGKTSLLCSILQSFPERLVALKCSTIYPDEVFCPATDTDCACRNLDGDFVVIDDPKTIRCPKTDTAKLDASGALRTLWCLARPPHHDRLWALLRSSFLDSRTPVVCEGNSVVPYMKPDLKIFVVAPDRPRSIWKENAGEWIATADIVIVNSPDPAGKSELSRMRGSNEGIIAEDARTPVNLWRDRSLFDRILYLLENPL